MPVRAPVVVIYHRSFPFSYLLLCNMLIYEVKEVGSAEPAAESKVNVAKGSSRAVYGKRARSMTESAV
jgi:hypothetical protein